MGAALVHSLLCGLALAVLPGVVCLLGGGVDLAAPVQSLPGFYTGTIPVTAGGYLLCRGAFALTAVFVTELLVMAAAQVLVVFGGVMLGLGLPAIYFSRAPGRGLRLRLPKALRKRWGYCQSLFRHEGYKLLAVNRCWVWLLALAVWAGWSWVSFDANYDVNDLLYRSHIQAVEGRVGLRGRAGGLFRGTGGPALGACRPAGERRSGAEGVRFGLRPPPAGAPLPDSF